MAGPVQRLVVIEWDLPVSGWRNAGSDPSRVQRVTKPVAVVAAVGDQPLGLWQGIEHEPCALVIAHLAFGKHHHQWLASVVADEVQF
jgi:hypothetical protein